MNLSKTLGIVSLVATAALAFAPTASADQLQGYYACIGTSTLDANGNIATCDGLYVYVTPWNGGQTILCNGYFNASAKFKCTGYPVVFVGGYTPRVECASEGPRVTCGGSVAALPIDPYPVAELARPVGSSLPPGCAYFDYPSGLVCW